MQQNNKQNVVQARSNILSFPNCLSTETDPAEQPRLGQRLPAGAQEEGLGLHRGGAVEGRAADRGGGVPAAGRRGRLEIMV